MTDEIASPQVAEAAPTGESRSGRLGPPSWLAIGFLLPALLLLGALVVYPIVYSAFRSLYDASGKKAVGLRNYTDIFSFAGVKTHVPSWLIWWIVVFAIIAVAAPVAGFTGRIRRPTASALSTVALILVVAPLFLVFFHGRDNLVAIRNTVIWVVVAPTVVTAVGLIFAVLTERIRWSTAFKMIVFMPMAVSFLASGVTFRLVYEQDPNTGVANAIMKTVHDTFESGARYPGASARETNKSPIVAQGGGVVTRQGYQPGQTALLPLVGVKPENLPKKPTPAKAAAPAPGGLSGTAWFDFTKGGGGTLFQIDSTESGLSGMTVQAVKDGKVAASTHTDKDGTFTFKKLPPGSYTLKLPKSNFTAAYAGADWLGQTLITPAIIGAYIWVWAGFAMVLIAAGLAAIPRDALEAARVDGGTEWQVFRRVTIPLLAPVLTVVLVTLVIYALKVFDLIFIIGGGDPNASVLAVRMWTQSFGGGNDQGAGSAIAILLFLLVVPAMLFNLRRFRQENQ